MRAHGGHPSRAGLRSEKRKAKTFIRLIRQERYLCRACRGIIRLRIADDGYIDATCEGCGISILPNREQQIAAFALEDAEA